MHLNWVMSTSEGGNSTLINNGAGTRCSHSHLFPLNRFMISFYFHFNFSHATYSWMFISHRLKKKKKYFFCPHSFSCYYFISYIPCLYIFPPNKYAKAPPFLSLMPCSLASSLTPWLPNPNTLCLSPSGFCCSFSFLLESLFAWPPKHPAILEFFLPIWISLFCQSPNAASFPVKRTSQPGRVSPPHTVLWDHPFS